MYGGFFSCPDGAIKSIYRRSVAQAIERKMDGGLK
jgi:hypothetical protein